MFTANEIAIFKGSRGNEYANVFEEGGTQTFSVIDYSGLDPKVARGVISSLIKKGIILIIDDNGYGGDTTTFEYTVKGKKLAWNALTNAQNRFNPSQFTAREVLFSNEFLFGNK